MKTSNSSIIAVLKAVPHATYSDNTFANGCRWQTLLADEDDRSNSRCELYVYREEAFLFL